MKILKRLKRFFNKVCNDAKYNKIIIGLLDFFGFIGSAYIYVCTALIYFFKSGENHFLSFYNNSYNIIYLVLILFFLGFFSENLNMIVNKDYQKRLTRNTIRAVKFYLIFLLLIIVIALITLKFRTVLLIKFFSTAILYLVSIYYAWILWLCIVYFVFCIRLLNSINVNYSIFLVIAVKSILIAIAAWLAIYKSSRIPSEYSINLLVAALALLYPILDMYKYVRLELDKYMKDNNIPIKIKSHSD